MPWWNFGIFCQPLSETNERLAPSVLGLATSNCFLITMIGETEAKRFGVGRVDRGLLCHDDNTRCIKAE